MLQRLLNLMKKKSRLSKIPMKLYLALVSLLALFGTMWKLMGQQVKIKQLKDKADTLERINEVPTNTDVNDSLIRLRKRGQVRDEDPL